MLPSMDAVEGRASTSFRRKTKYFIILTVSNPRWFPFPCVGDVPSLACLKANGTLSSPNACAPPKLNTAKPRRAAGKTGIASYSCVAREMRRTSVIASVCTIR
jgi:hypothetical protein